jgi:glycosyltransferase involved in cell wall biosynthesis
MAEKIVVLLKDDKLRSRLGRAAFERALDHFTVDRMVEGTIALYERLLAGRPVNT